MENVVDFGDDSDDAEDDDDDDDEDGVNDERVDGGVADDMDSGNMVVGELRSLLLLRKLLICCKLFV